MKLRDDFDLPFDHVPCMHECVFSDRRQSSTGVTTLDMAKRLMDYGYHPPTVYFPSIVHGAMMIEPTETESLQTLDGFIGAMKAMAEEAGRDPSVLKAAPHRTVTARVDEVRAVRRPCLRWREGMAPGT